MRGFFKLMLYVLFCRRFVSRAIDERLRRRDEVFLARRLRMEEQFLPPVSQEAAEREFEERINDDPELKLLMEKAAKYPVFKRDTIAPNVESLSNEDVKALIEEEYPECRPKTP